MIITEIEFCREFTVRYHDEDEGYDNDYDYLTFNLSDCMGMKKTLGCLYEKRSIQNALDCLMNEFIKQKEEDYRILMFEAGSCCSHCLIRVSDGAKEYTVVLEDEPDGDCVDGLIFVNRPYINLDHMTRYRFTEVLARLEDELLIKRKEGMTT